MSVSGANFSSEIDDAPSSVDAMLEMWMAAVVENVTVYIQSPTAALVAVPVASVLLTPGCHWQELACSEAPDPCFMLRALEPNILESFTGVRSRAVAEEGWVRYYGESSPS